MQYFLGEPKSCPQGGIMIDALRLTQQKSASALMVNTCMFHLFRGSEDIILLL